RRPAGCSPVGKPVPFGNRLVGSCPRSQLIAAERYLPRQGTARGGNGIVGRGCEHYPVTEILERQGRRTPPPAYARGDRDLSSSRYLSCLHDHESYHETTGNARGSVQAGHHML